MVAPVSAILALQPEPRAQTCSGWRDRLCLHLLPAPPCRPDLRARPDHAGPAMVSGRRDIPHQHGRPRPLCAGQSARRWS